MTATGSPRFEGARPRWRRFVVGAAVLSAVATTLAASPGAAQTDPVAGETDQSSSIPVAGESSSAQLPGSKFAPITPTRVLDTRPGKPMQRGFARLASDTALSIDPIRGSQVATQLGNLGIDLDDVTAVVANVTLVQAGRRGHATVWRTGFPKPNTSTNNAIFTGHNTPNVVIAPLGIDGKISIASDPDADYIIDVMGVMVKASSSRDGRFISLGPVRHSNTSNPTTIAPNEQRYTANEVRVVDLKPAGVPASATAVVLNVTARFPDALGFIRVWKAGERPIPTHSNVNVRQVGWASSNQVITAVDNGRIEIFSKMPTDLIIDVAGFFTGPSAANSTDGLFVPTTPGRLLNSRATSGSTALTNGQPILGGDTQTVPVVNRLDIPATGVKAAAFNVTAVQPVGAGFVTAFPGSTNVPPTSSVNYLAAGDVVPNHAITTLGTNGAIDLFTKTTTHMIVDVTGFFIDETGTVPTGNLPTKTIDHGSFVPAPLTNSAPTNGPYDFLFDRGTLLSTGSRPSPTQRVAWDACAPLRYALNVDLADDAQIQVLIDSIEEMEEHSGIDFQFAGVTSAGMNIADEVILAENFGLPYQFLPPDDDGSGPVDLVIGYSDPVQTPELGGSVIGVGGSLRTQYDSSGRADAARGFAIIDLPDLAGTFNETNKLLATTTHELGHMMGLGHVDESSPARQGLNLPGSWSVNELRDQLMYPSLSSNPDTMFADGDVLGLWELYNPGEQNCGTTLRAGDDDRPLVAVEMVLDEAQHDDHDDH